MLCARVCVFACVICVRFRVRVCVPYGIAIGTSRRVYVYRYNIVTSQSFPAPRGEQEMRGGGYSYQLAFVAKNGGGDVLVLRVSVNSADCRRIGVKRRPNGIGKLPAARVWLQSKLFNVRPRNRWTKTRFFSIGYKVPVDLPTGVTRLFGRRDRGDKQRTL